MFITIKLTISFFFSQVSSSTPSLEEMPPIEDNDEVSLNYSFIYSLSSSSSSSSSAAAAAAATVIATINIINITN